jgi:hypothetical protein
VALFATDATSGRRQPVVAFNPVLALGMVNQAPLTGVVRGLGRTVPICPVL